jgi:hypothetical protein
VIRSFWWTGPRFGSPALPSDLECYGANLSVLVWRGKGGVIALITFGSLVLSDLLTRAIFVDPRYYQTHEWPKLVGFWVSAGVVYALFSWLGVGQERALIDKATGQEIKASLEGELFFIPARFWPAILVGLGIVFFIVRT